MEKAGLLAIAPVATPLKERLIAGLCGSVPLGVWHRLFRTQLVVPHWHVVSDFELPHISGLYRFRRIHEFKADLEYFLKEYKPVSLEDVIQHLHEDRALPSKCVLFTFDDGFREVHDVIAPLLRASGVPATFFLISSVIDNRQLAYPQKISLIVKALAAGQPAAVLSELDRMLTQQGIPKASELSARIRGVSYQQRHILDELGPVVGCDYSAYLASNQPYLTAAQVRNLICQGFTIGAHSVDHPPYAELSLEAQVSQTRESLRSLSERFQLKCQSFAFPYRDNGVSLDYFRAIFADGQLKVSFGTGGLIPHPFPHNLPRFPLERTNLPAAQILAGQFGRRLFRVMRPHQSNASITLRAA